MDAFLTIWTKPDETSRRLIDNASIWFGGLIVMISSLGAGIMAFSDSGLSSDVPLTLIVLISTGASVLSSFVFYFINSGVYMLLAKMFGGRGTYRQNALATASGSLPMIALLPISLLAVALFRERLFEDVTDPFVTSNMPVGFYLFYMLVTLGVTIYGTVILSRGIGYANGFSAMKGFAVVLIYGAILFLIGAILILILIVLFFMLVGAFS